MATAGRHTFESEQWVPSAPVHALFVRGTVERIFAHRHLAIAQALGDHK